MRTDVSVIRKTHTGATAMVDVLNALNTAESLGYARALRDALDADNKGEIARLSARRARILAEITEALKQFTGESDV